jgi:hypothetical protein
MTTKVAAMFYDINCTNYKISIVFQNSLAGLNKTLYSTREKLIHPLVCHSDTRVGESFSFSTRTVIYYLYTASRN